ncbi:ABC transporter [Halioglobus japonicus]|uniref:Transport permease protein n=1 Tax=Halioglobus japonicus TaxID=930805 RepID=A0AAP8MD16_9GAMM|nr:ABC transporter permease [Halioglobus japonicus]AQA17618.1 ABC transporter [Halioglobus japonicus]PLW85557.1 ABC transporter permease [Halioglobus japonicus]GHD16260.1 transport permease protein [Halioglobus japonicus]
MSWSRRIGAVAGKEFRQLSRDRITFGMVVMIPLIQLLLFGYAINTVVRDIPIAVVDLSHSAVARAIAEQVRVTQVVDVVTSYDTPAEAEAAIVAGTIRAALVLPVDLTQRLAAGQTAGQWMVDGSDTVVGSAMLALRNMPLQLQAGTPPGAYTAGKPSFEVALFFNPERRSEVNVVPGLTAIILTMTMILFTSAALVRETERGNMELLITTPVRPLELMIGKLVPYVFVGLIQIAIILGLGQVVFNVVFQGELLDLAIITVAFIAACLTLGLLISTIATTQMQAMQMTVFILLPSILLSGFMFPYEAMPEVAQWIAEVLPATHFMRLIRGVYLRGAEFHQLLPDILWLLGFTVVVLAIATKRFNKTLD